jgi:hypothetical protein
MIRQQIKSASVMTPLLKNMPLVALCSLARASAIAVSVCGDKIPEEEMQEMRENLKRAGERWILGSECAFCQVSQYG